MSRRTPQVAAVTSLIGPQRKRAADDGAFGDRSEVTAIEALGIDPADVAPDHWRHIHNRLTAGAIPHAYTRERHAAWLKRQRIAL